MREGRQPQSKPELIVDGKNRLGESAMWHPREQRLYWVDVRGPAMYRLEADNSVTAIPLPALAGGLVPRKSGGLCHRAAKRLPRHRHRNQRLTFIADPEPDKPDNRINDGSCDRLGRFWAGTQHVTIREPRGSLYRLDPDHSVRKMLEGITVSNMVRFSPDDRTLYYADTYSDVMYALKLSLADGTIANRRVFVDTSSHPGHPDGSAIDADGCLWNAEYGGSRVVRYTPQGQNRSHHRVSGDAADQLLLRRIRISTRSMSPARRSGSSQTCWRSNRWPAACSRCTSA